RDESIQREEAEGHRAREQLAERERNHENAAAKFETDRRAVEQMRVTYAAGLAQLEARQREVAEREVAAAAQARRAAALQTRMRTELDRVQQERSERLSNRDGGGAESQRLRVVAEQLETERVALRRQEEALVAHEQALRARTDQLAQIERHLQDRSREI